jgi:hypothetical protein
MVMHMINCSGALPARVLAASVTDRGQDPAATASRSAHVTELDLHATHLFQHGAFFEAQRREVNQELIRNTAEDSKVSRRGEVAFRSTVQRETVRRESCTAAVLSVL